MCIRDSFKGLDWDSGTGKVSDTESDGEELEGGPVGGRFEYSTSWDLQRIGPNQGGSSDSMKSCKFEGSAKQMAKTNITFFDTNHELMYSNGEVSARTNPGSMRHQARWKDLDSGSTKYLEPPNNTNGSLNKSFGPGESVGRFAPPIYLADVDYTYWIVIAEFPVKLTFGFSASAGMYFGFAGQSGNNCSDATLKAPTNYRLTLGAFPYLQADAFADASINYPGVAAAGVRLDLTLLKFSLPMGVDISNTVGADWSFRVGGRIGVDMLSGSLSAYVSVGGPPPLEVTFWAKVADWPGFHADLATWGLNRSVPSGAVRALLAKFPDLGEVDCQLDSGSNAACSLLTQPNSSTAPCPGGGCTGTGGVPEFKKVTGKSDWYLCRFNEYDRNRLGQYKDACKDYTR